MSDADNNNESMLYDLNYPGIVFTKAQILLKI
jgi:hypothetical protein